MKFIRRNYLFLFLFMIFLGPDSVKADGMPIMPYEIKFTYEGGGIPGGVIYIAKDISCTNDYDPAYIANDDRSKQWPDKILNIHIPDKKQACEWIPTNNTEFVEIRSDTIKDFYRVKLGRNSEIKWGLYVPKIDKVFLLDVTKAYDGRIYEAALSVDSGTKLSEKGLTDFFKDYQRTSKKTSTFGDWPYYILSFLLTVFVEIIITTIYVYKNYLSKIAVLLVFLANVISFPIATFILYNAPKYFGVTGGGIDFLLIYALIEAGVIFFESILYYYFIKHAKSYLFILIFSFLINFGSILIAYALMLLNQAHRYRLSEELIMKFIKQ